MDERRDDREGSRDVEKRGKEGERRQDGWRRGREERRKRREGRN